MDSPKSKHPVRVRQVNLYSSTPSPSPEYPSTPDTEKQSPLGSTTLEVPDGGLQAWTVVFAVFLFNVGAWASNSSFAVYLAHYLQYDTFAGASKLDYAAIGGISYGGGLACAPLVRLIQRHIGLKLTIWLGTILQCIGFILAAFSTKLWQLYLTQGVLTGLALGLSAIPSMGIIPQWFRKKRSLAMAICVAGSGLGGIIFNLGAQEIIDKYGLKWALIAQGLIATVCNVTGVILVKTRTSGIDTVVAVWDWKIMRFLAFWLVAMFVCLTLMGYVVLMYNLADFTLSLGYSAHQGSVVSCMVFAGSVFGRPGVGKLCDIFGPVTATFWTHVLVSLLCFAMWIPARNYATAIAFAFISGGMMGTLYIVLAPVTTRLVGLRNLDVGMGMLWVFVGCCGIVSPIIGTKLRGVAPSEASYDPTQYGDPAIWCGTMYVGSAVVLWLIRGYLIARDREAEKTSSHEDDDELKVRVDWTSWSRGLFALSKTRKI